MEYSRICEHDLYSYNELRTLRKQIAGTISFKPHNSLDNSAWLYRLAVDPEYNFLKISELLTEDMLKWCKEKRFYAAETSTWECHQDAREMYFKAGFV